MAGREPQRAVVTYVPYGPSRKFKSRQPDRTDLPIRLSRTCIQPTFLPPSITPSDGRSGPATECGSTAPPLTRNRGSLEGPADVFRREEHIRRERPSVDADKVVHRYVIAANGTEQLLHFQRRRLESGELSGELIHRKYVVIPRLMP